MELQKWRRHIRIKRQKRAKNIEKTEGRHTSINDTGSKQTDSFSQKEWKRDGKKERKKEMKNWVFVRISGSKINWERRPWKLSCLVLVHRTLKHWNRKKQFWQKNNNFSSSEFNFFLPFVSHPFFPSFRCCIPFSLNPNVPYFSHYLFA